MFTVGVDASNIRSGGGLKNLVELIANAEPHLHNFSSVKVWIGTDIVGSLPKREWLEVIGVEAFDQGVIKRNIQRRKLREEIRSSCDIVYTPGGILLDCGLPEVVVSQNMQPFDPIASRGVKWGYARLRLFLLKHLMSKAFRQADGVVFLNEYIRKLLTTQLGLDDSRSVAILMGSSEELHLAPRPQLPIADFEQPYKLLYVSTINTYKHQKEVLEAFLSCSDQYNIQLELVGGGYEPYLSEFLHLKEQLDVNNRVIYHGKVPPAEMVKYYHSADAFLFASSCENLPNILIEAMSAGLPIASSSIEPMPTVLEDAGIYFDPHNPESISNAIVSLVENHEQRAKLAELAYAKRTNFSWTEWSDSTFRFLSEVLTKNAGTDNVQK